ERIAYGTCCWLSNRWLYKGNNFGDFVRVFPFGAQTQASIREHTQRELSTICRLGIPAALMVLLGWRKCRTEMKAGLKTKSPLGNPIEYAKRQFVHAVANSDRPTAAGRRRRRELDLDKLPHFRHEHDVSEADKQCSG